MWYLVSAVAVTAVVLTRLTRLTGLSGVSESREHLLLDHPARSAVVINMAFLIKIILNHTSSESFRVHSYRCCRQLL